MGYARVGNSTNEINRSLEEIASLQQAMERARSSIIYGVTTGPELSDMHPFMGAASRLLIEVGTNGSTNRVCSLATCSQNI